MVSRRAWLWIAFAAGPLMIAIFGFTMPNQPMGDVYFVYEPWSEQAVNGFGIVGVDRSWVYPQLAIVPMLLALALRWIAGYEVAWSLLVTLVDAVAFALLIGRAR